MDVWGVESVEAEAELLSAATAFCSSVGLSAADVGVRVSSRRVLSELLAQLGVPDSLFTRTCILIDKVDKIGEVHPPHKQARARKRAKAGAARSGRARAQRGAAGGGR
jgi:histidyl-tRNA synthetase